MKKTIYIIIIVLALGGAIVMGYMAMTSGDKSSAPDSVTGESVSGSLTENRILPFGTDFSFDELKKYNKTNTTFPYPKVDNSEVGKILGEILE